MAFMGAIAPYLLAAGTALSAYGSMRAGQAAEAGAEYDAKIAEANAKAATESARDEETRLRARNRRLLARERVMYAKAGVDIAIGSPLLVLAEDAAKMEEDAQNVRYNGLIQATGYRNQAINSRFRGEQANIAGMFGAGTSIVQGMGTFGMNYMNKKKPGYGGM